MPFAACTHLLCPQAKAVAVVEAKKKEEDKCDEACEKDKCDKCEDDSKCDIEKCAKYYKVYVAVKGHHGYIKKG